MHHYKAPHDMFEFAPRYADYLADVEIPEPVDIQPMVQKGAAKTHAAAEKNNVPETEAEDAKPVITYKPLKMKPKSPEKPVPAPRKESPAKPKPNRG